ncbi:uncharacterized protein N7500_000416 [Penicillium coprophilum]|uniref:uncharacterized protein n=1 Tax=Penicillium coprophilum TaxID=36646 RepID=UPI00239F167C|nr:uncharacterized protein N7500_000416 [Penicillium coprophilum]KAJ5177717.1 hypothetical protein N7500_000416 [Penicillium coprophilum]
MEALYPPKILCSSESASHPPRNPRKNLSTKIFLQLNAQIDHKPDLLEICKQAEAPRRSRERKRKEEQQIESLESQCAFDEPGRFCLRDELHRYIPSSELPPRPPTRRSTASTSSPASSSPRLETVDRKTRSDNGLGVAYWVL